MTRLDERLSRLADLSPVLYRRVRGYGLFDRPQGNPWTVERPQGGLVAPGRLGLECLQCVLGQTRPLGSDTDLVPTLGVPDPPRTIT